VTAGLDLAFLGHSTVTIDLDGVRIVTDPVTRSRVGPLRRVEPVPARDRLTDIDAVLISHLHWDHLDVPSLRDLGRGVPLYVPAGSGPWMQAAGFRDVHELGVGESTSISGVEVRAVPAVHSGYRPPFGPTAPPLGFVITGTRTVYFAGDTDLFAGMADLGDAVDVALIPVWGWGPTLGRGLHLDPRKAADALRLIRPRVAVPIHWGTYWPHALGRVYPERLVEPPAAFAEYAAEVAPDVRVVPTEVGASVDLGPSM
jgi:L-ascorbate metabolism protein UlaG (beta-lactamase superfamily)